MAKRIIPKQIKTRVYIFKQLTLTDIIIITALMGLAYLIYLTNFQYKWIYMIVVPLFFAGILLPKPNDVRIVQLFGFSLKYLISKKIYKREDNSIKTLIPDVTFSKNNKGFINFGKYFGTILSINSIEFALKTEKMQDQLINLLGQGFNMISSGGKLQLIKIDRPINYDDYIKYLNDKLASEENKSLRDENKIGVLRTRIDQADLINNLDLQYHEYFYFALYSKTEQDLLNTLEPLINMLNRIGLEPNRLNNKEVAIVLRYMESRNFDERMFNNLDESKYLENTVPQTITFKKSKFIIDDKLEAFTYTINEYKMIVGNAWAVGLFSISNTKVVMNIEPIDYSKASKAINLAFREYSDKAERVGRATEQADNQLVLESLEELLANIKRDSEQLFNVNIVITAYNYDNDKSYSEKVSKAIKNCFLGYFPGRNRQIPFYLNGRVNMLPVDKTFSRAINTFSLAAAFPFVFTQINDPKGYMIGYSEYPVVLDIWKWKEDTTGRYINANAFVLGKSGSGKSFFTKTLISELLSDDVKVLILDPENEYKELVHNFKGKFIDVGTAINGRINPFHIYQILTDDGENAPTQAVFSSHLNLLSSFFKIILPGLDSDSITELNNLIVNTYNNLGINEKTDTSNFPASSFPTFDDLMKEIDSSLAKNANSYNQKRNLEIIKSYINQFVGGSRNANLWNGYSTIEANESLVVFNFQSLLMSNNNVIANAQMLLVMRYLEQLIINIREINRNRIIKDQMKTFIAIDEGYVFVNEEMPTALDFIYIWYKRARKYNAAMYFATQNLGDIMGKEKILAKSSTIIANSQYHFIFNLAELEMTVLDKVYNGRINETEKNEIMGLTKGRCFLISSEKERTKVQIEAHNIVRRFFEKEEDLSVNEYLDFLQGLHKDAEDDLGN
jgi:hypothetical protein